MTESANRAESSKDALRERGGANPRGGVPKTWVTKTGSGIRFVGKGLALIGAFMSGYRIGSAINADIEQGTGGKQAAKAVAVEAGGWAAAGAGALLGAKGGVACGPYVEICSPVFAIGLGIVGFWGGASVVESLINNSGRSDDRRYKSIAPGEVLDTETNRVFIKAMP